MVEDGLQGRSESAPAAFRRARQVRPAGRRAGGSATRGRCRSRVLVPVGILAVAVAAGPMSSDAEAVGTPTATTTAAFLPTGLGPGGGPGPYRGWPFGPGSTGTVPAAAGPSDASAIAARVDPGLVDITTTVPGGEAAGTGMVLTGSGEVLTNNHVIDGADSIRVRDVGNGKTYTASVVGYDESADIAVLKLAKASGLTTVRTSSAGVTVGSGVVGIGNAGGTGGTPSYAGGTVTALGQTITAGDAYSGSTERLTHMIVTDADIQAGDSGGALANTAGRVIGMDTAAATGFGFEGLSDTTAQGFAIPISSALAIAREITSGKSSSTVHIGPTARLGVEVTTIAADDGYGPNEGVYVEQATAGGPAAAAGLTSGSVITALAGKSVTSAESLGQLITQLRPGQAVPTTWTDPDGSTHTATVTLGTGAPQ